MTPLFLFKEQKTPKHNVYLVTRPPLYLVEYARNIKFRFKKKKKNQGLGSWLADNNMEGIVILEVVLRVNQDIKVQSVDSGCRGSGHANVPEVWTGLEG